MCIHLRHHVICWVLGSSEAHLSHLIRIHSMQHIAIFREVVSHPWACSVLLMNDCFHSRNHPGIVICKSRDIGGNKRGIFSSHLSPLKLKENLSQKPWFFLLVSLAEPCHMIIPYQSLVRRNWSALISLNKESLMGPAGYHLKIPGFYYQGKKERLVWDRQPTGRTVFMHSHIHSYSTYIYWVFTTCCKYSSK